MTEEGFLNTLKRVEAVSEVLNRMEDMDAMLKKITTIEQFTERFGTLEDLIERFESVEKQLYFMKEMLNLEEAARYLNISTGHMYRLTSSHEITYSKPNGKHIFFERKELDEWKRRNPILSKSELDRRAVLASIQENKEKTNRKGKNYDNGK